MENKLPEDWMTFRSAAMVLGVKYDALRQYVYQHKLPCVKVGNTWIIRRADLKRYEENMRGPQALVTA